MFFFMDFFKNNKTKTQKAVIYSQLNITGFAKGIKSNIYNEVKDFDLYNLNNILHHVTRKVAIENIKGNVLTTANFRHDWFIPLFADAPGTIEEKQHIMFAMEHNIAAWRNFLGKTIPVSDILNHMEVVLM